jgi:ABC-type polysaccharide/polyol phosphate export permease
VHLARKGYGQGQFFRAGASLGQGSTRSVESKAMRRTKQQFLPVRSIWAFAVLSLIALLLVLSIAIASGADHGFDQISLALPIFFVLLFLATSIGDWLQVEDFFTEPKPRFSTSLTRAPPA